MRKHLAVALVALLVTFLLVGFVPTHKRVTQFDQQDWLPLTQLGSGVIYDSGVQSINSGASFTSPVLPVAPYAQLVTETVIGNNGNFQTQLSWFKDPGGTLAGINQSNIQYKNTNSGFYPSAVMSPYAQVKATNNSGANTTVRIVVFAYTATTRLSSQAIAGGTATYGGGTQSILAGGQLFVAVQPNVPARITIGNTSTGSAKVEVQRWNGTQFQVIAGHTYTAAFDDAWDTTLPPDSCQIVLTDTSGAGQTAGLAATLQP